MTFVLQITRKCTELSADALIVGSRGMGAVKRTLLGSVSDHLVHHVPCPTIVCFSRHGFIFLGY